MLTVFYFKITIGYRVTPIDTTPPPAKWWTHTRLLVTTGLQPTMSSLARVDGLSVILYFPMLQSAFHSHF